MVGKEDKTKHTSGENTSCEHDSTFNDAKQIPCGLLAPRNKKYARYNFIC